MKKFYLLMFLGSALIFTSCDKKKEVVGPTGPAGVNGTNGTDGKDGKDGEDGTDGTNGIDGQNGTNGTNGTNGVDGQNGTNGTNGTNGVDGKDALVKEGSISGKIVGTRASGEPLDESFSFDYMQSLSQSRVTLGEGVHVEFERRGIDADNNISFDYYSNNLTEAFNPSDLIIDFNFIKDLGNGKYFVFYINDNWSEEVKLQSNALKQMWNGNSQMSISNYSYDENTGNLKFDFVLDLTAEENSTGNEAQVTGKVDVTLRSPSYKTAAK